jgi:HK97 family phage major capsid protein
MTIREIQERREVLVVEARERLDQINAATDESRAKELEIQHDAALAELDKLDRSIAREQKQAALEARVEEARARMRPTGGDLRVSGQADGEKSDYRTAFYAMLRAGGDMSEVAPEHRAALRAGLAEFRVQSAGTTTAGGFTVPTELANEIIVSMLAFGPMYDPLVARELLTSSGNAIKIPTVNDTAVTAAAHTEGTALGLSLIHI